MYSLTMQCKCPKPSGHDISWTVNAMSSAGNIKICTNERDAVSRGLTADRSVYIRLDAIVTEA